MDAARVWKFGDDVDTDAMAPGAYMKFGIAGIAAHCMEGLRPEFAPTARPGDLIVAGRNFGVGSSREQAPQALLHLGVAAVVAVSFAGLFYRNALNVGLPVMVCPQAGDIGEGSLATVDFTRGRVEVPALNRSYDCEPIPPFLLEMLNNGGLLLSLRRRFNPKVLP